MLMELRDAIELDRASTQLRRTKIDPAMMTEVLIVLYSS